MSNCKVIALTNQKGGVGKTTTAVNLGVGLAKQGKRVLLIDADAQANLTMALGYSRPDDLPITLSTIMQNIIDDKSFDVSQGILSHSEGVDLLPSNIELSGFEVRLINAMSRERVLKTYVNEVKKNYDYVLIDCMPSLGMITINALAAADSVVIPTQPHYLSAKGLELLLRSVSMVKRQINPKLRIDGITMTIVVSLTMIFVGCYLMKAHLALGIALLAFGAAVVFATCFVGVRIEHDTGYYECPVCKKRYVPTMKAVVMALHSGTSRKMKCPYCGNKSYHKKVLTK